MISAGKGHSYEDAIHFCTLQLKDKWDLDYQRKRGYSLLPYGKVDGYYQPPSLQSLAGNSIKKQLFFRAYVRYVYHHSLFGYFYPYGTQPFVSRLGTACTLIRKKNLDAIQEEARHIYREMEKQEWSKQNQ